MEGKGGIGGSALPGNGEWCESRVGASRGDGGQWLSSSMNLVTGSQNDGVALVPCGRGEG
jgi:hypothetical protein